MSGERDFGQRPGEIAIDLPDRFDSGLYFIGRIHTPWRRREDCPHNGAETDAVCTVELSPPFVAGLADLEGCSHVWVLAFMDKAPRNLVRQRPRCYGETRGVFALRSPARPNPIGICAAELLAIDGNSLTVRGLDCMDGTPLIDIKPYFPSTDSRPAAVVGWHVQRTAKANASAAVPQGSAIADEE
jgi:tRNA-Thr(GGU) m(6)t(6)A37 methyltransferase TsaA